MIDTRYQRRVGALILPMMVIDWIAKERIEHPAAQARVRAIRQRRGVKQYRYIRLAELFPWNYSRDKKANGKAAVIALRRERG